jgi:hypothetical protein
MDGVRDMRALNKQELTAEAAALSQEWQTFSNKLTKFENINLDIDKKHQILCKSSLDEQIAYSIFLKKLLEKVAKREKDWTKIQIKFLLLSNSGYKIKELPSYLLGAKRNIFYLKIKLNKFLADIFLLISKQRKQPREIKADYAKKAYDSMKVVIDLANNNRSLLQEKYIYQMEAISNYISRHYEANAIHLPNSTGNKNNDRNIFKEMKKAGNIKVNSQAWDEYQNIFKKLDKDQVIEKIIVLYEQGQDFNNRIDFPTLETKNERDIDNYCEQLKRIYDLYIDAIKLRVSMDKQTEEINEADIYCQNMADALYEAALRLLDFSQSLLKLTNPPLEKAEKLLREAWCCRITIDLFERNRTNELQNNIDKLQAEIKQEKKRISEIKEAEEKKQLEEKKQKEEEEIKKAEKRKIEGENRKKARKEIESQIVQEEEKERKEKKSGETTEKTIKDGLLQNEEVEETYIYNVPSSPLKHFRINVHEEKASLKKAIADGNVVLQIKCQANIADHYRLLANACENDPHLLAKAINYLNLAKNRFVVATQLIIDVVDKCPKENDLSFNSLEKWVFILLRSTEFLLNKFIGSKDKLEKGRSEAQKNIIEKFGPSGWFKRYNLTLMSALPDNDKNKARFGIIYLSKTGKYIVRDLRGRVQEGEIDTKELNLDNLAQKLKFPDFKTAILQQTSKAGYTRNLPQPKNLSNKAKQRLIFTKHLPKLLEIQKEIRQIKSRLASIKQTPQHNVSGETQNNISIGNQYGTLFRPQQPPSVLRHSVSCDSFFSGKAMSERAEKHSLWALHSPS